MKTAGRKPGKRTSPGAATAPAPANVRKPAPGSEGRKRQGQVRLGLAVAKAAGPLLRRRGLAEESLLTHWPDVMGSMLASRVAPERIRTAKGETLGVLHLVVTSGAVGLEVQHMSVQILQRVNAFLGRQAVGRIVIRPGRLPARANPRPLEPELTEAQRATIGAAVERVEDRDLRAALLRLGEAVARRERRSPNRGG